MSRYDYILEISASGRSDAIEKANPWHDPATGRFTSAPGGISNGGAPALDPAAAKAELMRRIASGEVKTTLDAKKQSKHFKGSREYNKAIAKGRHPSLLTVGPSELQGLIDQYTKTGEARQRPDGTIRIYFKHSSPLGVCLDRTGSKQTNTSAGQIHFSQDGAHIVPDMP